MITLQQPTPTSENLLATIESKIQHRRYQEAQSLLLDMVAGMPKGWRPTKRHEDKRIEVAFWSEQEQLAYTDYFKESINEHFEISTSCSYSKAYYLLACLEMNVQNFDGAQVYINQAIVLEPDHPEILCTKALIMTHLGRYKDAYELYLNAIYSRAWNSNEIQAKAMRGAGIVLEELGSWEEAARMFKTSLELEPGDSLAMNELSYIYLQRMEILHKVQTVRKAWWKFW